MRSPLARAIGLLLAGAASVAAGDTEIRQQLGLEWRHFPHSHLPPQADNDISLEWEGYYRRRWNDGHDIFVAVPWARLNSEDSQRSRLDFQSLSWVHWRGDWEVRSGIRTVTWQVAESLHLVDVINQIDAASDVDREDKLGQPMVNLVWTRPWGSLELFVLPYFRERVLPGREGRLRPAVPFETDEADYESGAERWRTDAAARWSWIAGSFEMALSHFSGTSRDPMFNLEEGRLRPFYPVIDQTGLELQYAAGNWLWKFEGLTRSGFGERYAAGVGGFEYTYAGVGGSGYDLGVLAEYLWDERDGAVFANDFFAGLRFGLNDLAGTEMLIGGIVDADTEEYLGFAEFSRRLGGRWRISLDARAFGGPSRDADRDLGFLYRDDYFSLQLTRFF